MSQDQIYNLLENHKGQKLNAYQISDMIGLNIGSVHSNLKRMIRSNMVKYTKLWEPGKRHRIYWVE